MSKQYQYSTECGELNHCFVALSFHPMIPGWTHTSIAGHASDMYDPPGGARCALLYLHPVGGERLADNAAYTEAMAKHRAACCAPFAGPTWWADRLVPEFDPILTPERFLLDAVRPWMLERWKVAKLGAYGISMGGQGAVRLGFKYPSLFPAVASVAGAFDYHDRWGQGSALDAMYPRKEACRQDTAILCLNPAAAPPTIALACDPADEEWFRGNDRLREKLQALGVEHRSLSLIHI